MCHLLDIDPKEANRITYNEISEEAVNEAIKKPRPIDDKLVNAQQARRVLDRLVGYKISPILCKKIQNKLSAGRVQSVTLRLVVDREREIENFKPEEYWTLQVMLKKNDGSTETFKAKLPRVNLHHCMDRSAKHLARQKPKGGNQPKPRPVAACYTC